MFSPNGIQAVLFDLDGTLRHNQPTFHQAFCDFATKLGVNVEEQNSRSALRWLHYYWAQSHELLTDFETFGEFNDQFWQNHAQLYLSALGCKSDLATALAPDLSDSMREEYQFEDCVPEEVPAVLQALQDAGYQLAVASNRPNSYGQQLENLGLAKFFQFSLAAGVVNAWKPSAQIFNQALQLLGTTSEQTIYVGDNYFADVVGAQNANITPVLLDPEEIFPEATCTVIHSLADLYELLSD